MATTITRSAGFFKGALDMVNFNGEDNHIKPIKAMEAEVFWFNPAKEKEK